MIRQAFSESKRFNKTLNHNYDIVITGGGLAGTCAAIAAARKGCKVALIQDRPVLGGNSSSEVRLWALGATSHMGNNNRWAREGGIIGEILVENVFRNREGNTLIYDIVLIEKVKHEENIDLYLNTIVYDISKNDDYTIEKLTAFNPQNSTHYDFYSKLFIDSSGDGIVSYQAGVPFRMGAEGPDEFDEKFAPDVEDYGELLGHTLYFYSKKVDHAVKFIPPEFALKDIEKVTKIKDVQVDDIGTKFWWLEYGGRHDTIHETEEIKYELWKIVYGIWNHIKNSGKYEGAEYYTLEWVGVIPGKRESRRFEGEYMLKQKDIVEQREQYDAIAYGGWSLDLHPADGAYSNKRPCAQYHSKGVYQIPYRCYVPQKINNLLLAGRIISASHVAFGSTRVMLTCAYGGEAIGTAAALCIKNNLSPRDYIDKSKISELQQELIEMGHFIPYIKHQSTNLASDAVIKASSSLKFKGFEHSGEWIKLEYGIAQLIPCNGSIPESSIKVKSSENTQLLVELRVSKKFRNHTPDKTIETFNFELKKGVQEIKIKSQQTIEKPTYVFITLLRNKHVSVAISRQLISGILSVFNKYSPEVNNFGKQYSKMDIGVEEFEFWTPKRRPKGPNIALKLERPIQVFQPENIINGYFRPINQPNAWVAAMEDEHPRLTIEWPEKKSISSIKLFFDTDYDHGMETSQLPHPEDRVPYVVKDYKIFDDKDNQILYIKDNYQTINQHSFNENLLTNMLKIEFDKWQENVPISIMGIICK